MNLYPSLLTDQEQVFKQQLGLVKKWTQVKTIQADVIDGLYADNLTLNPIDLTVFDFADKQIDFHLMTVEPLDMVMELKNLKEHLPIRAIIAQVEKMSSQADFLGEVRANGWQTGLSLDLYTPWEAIDDDSWSQLDLVQVMGIKAGFQGQEFNPVVLDEIKRIKQLQQEKGFKFELVVDGGVKLTNLSQLQAAGVTGVAVGSGLWQAADPVQAVAEFTKLS